jgi:predicted nucleic acid-binding protein
MQILFDIEGQKAGLDDREIIRQLATRYSDDEIAWVLTRLGRRTESGKRWSEEGVKWVRRGCSIAVRRLDPDSEPIWRAIERLREIVPGSEEPIDPTASGRLSSARGKNSHCLL